MSRKFGVALVFFFLTFTTSTTGLSANTNSGVTELVKAVFDIFFAAGGTINLGYSRGNELSLANDYRRNQDLDVEQHRGRLIFGGHEKPLSGGPEVALGFDFKDLFVLYSIRILDDDLNTRVMTAVPPGGNATIRSTNYSDAGMNPRDLIVGFRFFRGNHVFSLHGGGRGMSEASTFSERIEPFPSTSVAEITEAVSNRFTMNTSGVLLGAGYGYELPIGRLFAELSLFHQKGNYSVNIASFESGMVSNVRELSVDVGRVSGYGGEMKIGMGIGNRFGPRFGISRTVLQMNLHRELYAAFDSTRTAGDLNSQALYLSRIRNKRGIRASRTSVFVEMRFAYVSAAKKSPN